MVWIEIANLKGAKGDPGAQGAPGAQGLPGVNAAASDATTAAYVRGASETQAALKEGYVDRTSARTFAGIEALASLPASFSDGPAGTVIALGYKALGAVERVRGSIAIGSQAMGNGTVGRDNIAIGSSALLNIQSYSEDYSQTNLGGTRNVGIGANSLIFSTDGIRHVAVGRNTGQCIEGGDGLVAIGSNANSGHAPVGLTGLIENHGPWGTSNQVISSVMIGRNAGNFNLAADNVAVGGGALSQNKRSNYNIAIGSDTLGNLDAGTGYRGGLNTTLDIAGTYVQSGNVVTVSMAAHTLAVGDIALIRLLTGASATFNLDKIPVKVVSVLNASTFTFAHPVSQAGSGTAQLYSKESGAQQAVNEHNVVVGSTAKALLTGSWNTVLGSRAFESALGGTLNTAVGYMALNKALNPSSATVVGRSAAANMTDVANVTALGTNALANKSDGSALTENWANITGIGANSRISGPNQVQLGDAATTTYVYGTVQNRSDARDKADIRDTVLGLDFIQSLRPVDYRWDMREDYEEGERDGSQKRARFHHGFVAQEVQEVIEESGVDFGGLQDHSIAGGSDVLSIGYDEIIAPLVKAVQEQQAIIAELIARVESLEGGADE